MGWSGLCFRNNNKCVKDKNKIGTIIVDLGHKKTHRKTRLGQFMDYVIKYKKTRLGEGFDLGHNKTHENKIGTIHG